jgi:hypothetical protein
MRTVAMRLTVGYIPTPGSGFSLVLPGVGCRARKASAIMTSAAEHLQVLMEVPRADPELALEATARVAEVLVLAAQLLSAGRPAARAGRGAARHLSGQDRHVTGIGRQPCGRDARSGGGSPRPTAGADCRPAPRSTRDQSRDRGCWCLRGRNRTGFNHQCNLMNRKQPDQAGHNSAARNQLRQLRSFRATTACRPCNQCGGQSGESV